MWKRAYIHSVVDHHSNNAYVEGYKLSSVLGKGVGSGLDLDYET